MCEYCKDGKLIKSIKSDLHDNVFAFVDNDDDFLTVGIELIQNIDGAEESDNLYIDILINYCPMCGALLNMDYKPIREPIRGLRAKSSAIDDCVGFTPQSEIPIKLYFEGGE